ncbi:MAG: hypothetical protein IJP30_00560 [Clostridia bacterium]|nr:hypothetical protein [Clostridia bacterium]
MREFDKLHARLTRIGELAAALSEAPETDTARQLAAAMRPLEAMEKSAARINAFVEGKLKPEALKGVLSGLAGQAKRIDGISAFHLYDTFGFPVEMTTELAEEHGMTVDMKGFETRFAAHQAQSHAGANQRFKGGLADATEVTARLHTATHLLLASLRRVLGDDIYQKGSNITAERLRFDFNFPRKVNEDELKQVEALVNDAIKQDLPITVTEMTVEEAHESGAIGVFGERYGERVKVYDMGGYSREICGGPHAARTGELGTFRIQKESSSSAGVRRIRAVLE